MNEFKRVIICIVLILIFICDSIFAVTVSDNDGSAFITKAEFDSLKSNFQNQINQYNSSIDNKIDSAIASYLAGIKTETETDINCLIDSEGVYGNKMKMSWNSNTSFRMVSTALPYPVHKYTYFAVLARINFNTAGDVTNDTSFDSAMWELPLLDKDGNVVSNLDAGTKKEYRVETVKINGTNYRMLRYVKVSNYFDFALFFGFPTNPRDGYNAGEDITGWDTANFLNDNRTKLTQKNLLAGQQLEYHRNWEGHYNSNQYLSNTSVLKTGNVMITQEYKEELEHVYAPFSETQEYVWDPDSEVTFSSTGGSYVSAPLFNPNADVTWVGESTNPSNVFFNNNLKPAYKNNYHFPWQHLLFKSGAKNEDGSDIEAKDAIIYNYYDIDKRNRAQKNGLVMGTTPDKNDVEIVCECSSDVNGTVYFYVGDTPIDNWESTSFAGKKFNLTAGADAIKCSLGKCSSKKAIWVLFKPTSTSANGKFKVNRLYYKMEV